MPLKWEKRVTYNNDWKAKVIQLTAQKPSGDLVNKVILHLKTGEIIQFSDKEIRVLKKSIGQKKFMHNVILLKKVFPNGEIMDGAALPKGKKVRSICHFQNGLFKELDGF